MRLQIRPWWYIFELEAVAMPTCIAMVLENLEPPLWGYSPHEESVCAGKPEMGEPGREHLNLSISVRVTKLLR